MSLKELTHEAHSNAERQEFVKHLFSGSMNPLIYAAYLKNQHPQYEILEVCAMKHGLLNDLPDVRRATAILQDYLELQPEGFPEPRILPSVEKYIRHILNIQDDPKKLMAHVYVRHMGDLAGGQMIATKVPGEGRYYKFENPDELKAAIREKIDDSLADEAKVCFEFATDFFKEMMTFIPPQQ
jgi:heme oxygenase